MNHSWNLINIFSSESCHDDLASPYRHAADHIMLWACVFLQSACLGLAFYRDAWISCIAIGGLTLLLACWMTHKFPGALATRLFMACAFMVYAGLIIHESGGSTESYVSIYCLTGILLYYRDWRVIVSATLFIYLHHLVLGYAQVLGWPVYVFETRNGWSGCLVQSTYSLPFVILLIYLAVSLRREGCENQIIIANYKKQAAVLQQTNEELKQSNIELQRFSYVASHDLQTPLRNIASFAELLQRGYTNKLDDQARHWMIHIIESTKKLQQLINDVLNYSSAGIIDNLFDQVSMHEVLNDAQLSIKSTIHDSGAKITHEDLPLVSGDRPQLVLLLTNLLSNAIKYRSEVPPRIHIEVSRKEHDWLFSVHDNGIGIDPQHHERIFEMFQRLHTSQKYPGTGIGLAICRSIVQRHGGNLWVHSLTGLGSIFCFTLPCYIESD